MSQKILLSCILNPLSSPLIHSYIILFSLLTRTTFCYVDPNFEACQPQTCGNQTISYPFHIEGRQDPSCGYPGFGISCGTDGFPILNLSNTPYIIDQIFYDNNSFRVSNAVFSRSSTNNASCLSATRNLTLPSPNKFNLVPNQKDIVLFFGCDLSSMSRELIEYRIGCSEENETSSVLALHKEDKLLSVVSKSCKGEVVDAVVKDWEEGIQEALRRGFLLNWSASDCSLCRSTGGRCGFDSTIFSFRCYCTDRVHASKCDTAPPEQGKTKLITITAASSVAVALLLLLACCFRRKLFTLTICCFWNKDLPSDEIIIERFLKQHGPLPTRRYSYSEIKKFTNRFKVKLGQGGYGSVYKGKLQDGRLVAVKVLSELKGTGEEFINEVASISRTSHVNIVALVGFCFQGSRRALVYEFMPNGSLEKFIYEENSTRGGQQLDCKTLYDIAIGVARGLDYLHRGCNTKILHFDIKPHNILLDQDFCPKISDFGLAKICPRKESIVSMMCARGTIGYIAPEVFSRNFGPVSHKADVYSYGMMVLETVGGRNNKNAQVDCSSELYFPHWIYKRLELNCDFGLLCIKDESDREIVRKMILVSLWCIQTDPSSRPSMSKVVEMLEGSLESLELPPKPFLRSSPASPAHYSTQTSETQ